MSDLLGRQVLPIPDPQHVGLTTYDAKDPDTSFPPIVPLRPPAGAPNVLVVLLDDAGFGSSSAFGGPVNTPNFDRLAEGGLRYTRFHTTALCSPTRQALLTGRNHHSVGMGGITEIATSAPGYSSVRPKDKAPLAETLKLNGYSTAQFGKCHEVPVWQTSPMGPFDAWPTGGGGFEHFYGFIGAETNQWAPAIYRDTVPIEPDRTPERGLPLHRGHDRPGDRVDRPAEVADAGQAVLRLLRARAPPTHRTTCRRSGPTATPAGSTPAGTRCARRPCERQREAGVIPADAELTARPAEIPAWDDMPDDLKPVLARQMEVYAGFLEHTDHHIGRLDRLPGRPGDPRRHPDLRHHRRQRRLRPRAPSTAPSARRSPLNGASALETVEFMTSRIDDFGGPNANNHYAVGWAHAMNTPYQWTKQVASHWGGTRNGMIVHWPPGITAKGELRTQFAHVIDVAPTVLEAAQPAAPDVRARHPAGAARGRQHAVLLRRRRRRRAARDAVLRDVRQPRHLPPGLDRGDPPLHPVGVAASSCRRSTTTSGSCTPPTTGPRPTTWPPSIPTGCATCSGCS